MGPRITLVFHFLNKFEDILRPSNWEPSSINTVMVGICSSFLIPRMDYELDFVR
jgi:hypothetical protein